MSQFNLIKKLDNGIRVGELATPHGVIQTPFFMPVGTVGSVKGVLPDELVKLGAEIILSNTYHLYLRPGEQLIKSLGGVHDFMRWDGPILTDSGGYQVFSLGKTSTHYGGSLKKSRILTSPDNYRGPQDDSSNETSKRHSLVKITEDGVEFKSHLDGSKHFFTPEKVIQIQLDLGVDILMPLDVCPSGKATREEIKQATEITIRWAERAKRYFDERMINYQVSMVNQVPNSNDQLIIGKLKFDNSRVRPMLHGIVQGGLDPDLRTKCAHKLMAMDFDGYSVGGLAVDLETRDMWDTVKLMGEILPSDKQRYLMGVGTPDDIIKATHLGMDMFDCVLPTRLARHGSVYVKCESVRVGESESQGATTHSSHAFTLSHSPTYELVNLLNSKFREDAGVIDPECGCPACKGGFSRAYIAHLLRSNEIVGVRLTTLHNLFVYLSLVKELRKS